MAERTLARPLAGSCEPALRFLPASRPHQTLRSTIEWSYDLLDDTEKGLLDRLSVFVGGFDLIALTAMAASVGLDEFDALDRLGSFVASHWWNAAKLPV